MLQLSHGQVQTQPGTTPNIRHIVVGRCFTYTTLINSSLSHDCEEIWRHFEEAVLHQPTCSVKVQHYDKMFDTMREFWPCDRFLFWSKTRTLMHSYAAVFRHFWTLENTLVGFMFNELVWCGQEEESGFDFNSCPEWSACGDHPVFSLWRYASQKFAEMACGNITVLLNGSIADAFNRKRESCSRGSITDLIQILQSRGFRWTCTDSDQTLMALLCLQNQQFSHQACTNPLQPTTSLQTPIY
uniref:ADP-ribosyl cyclase/cyclic ADP-ribose hydrolase n=1 Tax=Oryzias sinensis TaxID=183150 RepID=A0A8C7YYY6_9TELE